MPAVMGGPVEEPQVTNPVDRLQLRRTAYGAVDGDVETCLNALVPPASRPHRSRMIRPSVRGRSHRSPRRVPRHPRRRRRVQSARSAIPPAPQAADSLRSTSRWQSTPRCRSQSCDPPLGVHRLARPNGKTRSLSGCLRQTSPGPRRALLPRRDHRKERRRTGTGSAGHRRSCRLPCAESETPSSPGIRPRPPRLTQSAPWCPGWEPLCGSRRTAPART